MTRTSTSTAARPPTRSKRLLLQRAHDLALGLERHVGHLVEQQGAAMGALEACRSCAAAPSVAGLGAEQLDLDPVGPHRRAVEDDERPVGAARAGMEQARRHLLAGARRRR